MTMNGEMNI